MACGALCVVGHLCGFSPAALAQNGPSVVNSPHDLSAMGPGPVHAVDETQVCIFCHTPHHASAAAPLWNRYNPTAYYRIYRSPTLHARVDQPGPASKLCLSCHDGTIALGMVLSRPVADPIAMTQTYMPSGPANLTTDLSDDHPIGFRYDRVLSNQNRQVRQPDLIDHRLWLGQHGEVECITCHDPHDNELGNFLRITDREGTLCNACHQMVGWQFSAHALSPRTVPVAVTEGIRLPYRSMADNACRSCHDTHSAPQRVHLLYDRPSRLCLDCHDGVTAPSALPVLDQRYGHRVNRLFPSNPRPEQRLQATHFVECTDCHNPHAVAKDILANTRLDFASQGPLVPPAMAGVPGVSLAGVPVPISTAYYEVCFRCHGDRPVIVPDRILRQEDTLGNVRREFLPTVASAHPVTFPARNQAQVPSLLAEFRARPFISCQSCHNNPNARANGGSDIDGPHTSSFNYLLVARYDTKDFSMETPQSYALCYRCHDRNSILGDESFPYHRIHLVRGRTPCSACHAPHGVNGSPTEHAQLINFDITIVGGQRLYLRTGQFKGSCTLTCHGVQHVNFTYSH